MNWLKKLFSTKIPFKASNNVKIEESLGRGLYLAKENGLYGAIRRNFEIVVPFRYERIDRVSYEVYIAYKRALENRGDIFNDVGKCLAEDVGIVECNDFFIVFETKDGQKHLFCHFRQAVVLSNCSPVSFGYNYAIVQSDKYYLFNGSGALLFKTRYPFTRKTKSGDICFKTKDDNGFPITINKYGKILSKSPDW